MASYSFETVLSEISVEQEFPVNPLISVIMPMYQVEDYIRTSVNSVLAQTMQNFELILVDDASPDNSYEICKQEFGTDSHVRIVRHKKNQGLGSARNTGLRFARGKYIYFLDSDDIILPKSLETLWKVAEHTDADVVHTSQWFETTWEALLQKRKMTLRAEAADTLERELPQNLEQRLRKHWGQYATWSMVWLNLYRRDFLLEHNLKFVDMISEDESFAFAVYCFARKFYKICIPLYVYCKHEQSIMGNFTEKRVTKGLHALVTGMNFLEDIMNQCSYFDGRNALRQEMHSVLFRRLMENHISPFYRKMNENTAHLNQEQVTQSGMALAFGDNAPIFQWLIEQYHSLSQQTVEAARSLVSKQPKTRVLQTEEAHMLDIIKKLRTIENRVILFSTPRHGNLGDQSITIGEEQLLQNCFPHTQIIEIPTIYLIGIHKQIFWNIEANTAIRKDDILFLHGGGNLGNLYPMEEDVHRDIIVRFPDNKIIILPQSICFTKDESGKKQQEKSSEIYENHKNLYLICRDENSLHQAKRIFPNTKSFLAPDSAFMLPDHFVKAELHRQGVLFLLRKDKEKVRDEKQIQKIQTYLKNNAIAFEVADTVISKEVTSFNRKEFITSLLRRINRSRMVVTDRFHGVILSVLTGTPVLAFKSLDTKISSGILWFKRINAVCYADNKHFDDLLPFIKKYVENQINEEDYINYLTEREILRKSLISVIQECIEKF